MSLIFRRALATLGEGALSATSSSGSRAASSSKLRPALDRSRKSTQPIHVRERQEAHEFSPTLRNLTPSQELRFQQLRADGEYPGDEADARQAFLQAHDEWRSRVRGHRQVQRAPENVEIEEGEDKLSSKVPLSEFKSAQELPSAESLAAQRIYLPNIQIRLMRNHTAPGETYDTSIATFRIPPSMTKTDLRSYLFAAYNLPVTFIRTDNYLGSIARLGPAGQNRRIGGSKKNYKRAVVGLYEPFHYPDDVAELDAIIATEDTSAEAELRRQRAITGKQQREAWLNEQYMLSQAVTGKKRSIIKMAKGYRWRAKTHDNKVSHRIDMFIKTKIQVTDALLLLVFHRAISSERS